jgi:hypothetical protein
VPVVPKLQRMQMKEKKVASGPASYAHRVTFEQHKGYKLCCIDFSNSRQTDAAVEMIKQATEIIGQYPFASLRTLTDVSGSYMSLPVITALHLFARSNKPHVTRSAMIGLSPIHRVTLREVNRITGRDIREFKTREAAIVFLTAEGDD